MTERELLVAIASYGADRLAEAFASLTEVERKALLRVFMPFYRLFGRFAPIKRDSNSYGPEYPWLDELSRDSRWMLQWNCALGMLALGAKTEAKRVKMYDFSGVFYVGKGAEGAGPSGNLQADCWGAMVRVLSDRRPDWADAWLTHLLDDRNSTLTISWLPMQSLISLGVVQKPVGDGYYHAMSWGITSMMWRLPFGQTRGRAAISDYLRAYPELLEDVYAMFLTGSHYFLSGKDGWKENHRGGEESWARAMRRLTEEGLLDRMRLLRASLSALMEDFKGYILVGLIDFHEGMEPTPEELAALQSHYHLLLAAGRDSTAAFGLKMLGKIEKANLLDDQGYVASTGPVLERKGKGAAKVVLAQFQKIGKRSPQLLPEILDTIEGRGLYHRDPDVLEASLAVLESWKERLTPATRKAIGSRVNDLPMRLQVRARVLAGLEGAVVALEHGPAVQSKKGKACVAIPECWRTLAGVDSAIAAIEDGTMPPPLSFDLSDIPVLSGMNPIAPVETMDELFDLIARCIEGKFSAMDRERMLDGVSRIDPAETKNFARLASPLAARLGEPRSTLMGLVSFWLTRNAATLGIAAWNPVKEPERLECSIEDFIRTRIVEIGQRLQRGVFVPMLCLPTHDGGWVNPIALVQRLGEWERRQLIPDKFDLVQALLRLAPEGRSAESAMLDMSEARWSNIVRWSLTGVGGAEKGDDLDLWLAAARSRTPRAPVEVPGIGTAIIPGPDGGLPSRFDWVDYDEWRPPRRGLIAADNLVGEMNCQSEMGGPFLTSPPQRIEDVHNEYRRVVPGIERLHQPLRVGFGLVVDPPWVDGCGTLARPSVLFHQYPCVKYYYRKEAVEIDWAAMCWPHNDDALFASGLVDIALTLDVRSTKVWPEYAFLSPLFEADRPLTMPAVLLICLALCAPQGDLSRTAIDVLAECIGDGRAHPDIFADPVARMALTKWFQYGRFAANLGEVARVSPVHAWFVSAIVERHVAGWEGLPKNGHHVLELLVELLAQSGLGLGLGTSEALGKVKTGGKSGKLVKQLLGLAANDNGSMEAVREAMLAARVARAGRWAGA